MSCEQRATFGDDGFMRPCRSEIGPRLERRFRNLAVPQAAGPSNDDGLCAGPPFQEGPIFPFFGAGFRHHRCNIVNTRYTRKKRRTDMFECSPSFSRFQRSFSSYPDLLGSIAVSIEALNQTDREQYLDLAVFPEDQPVPESALIVLWKLDEIATRDCMTRLVARSLATWAIAMASCRNGPAILSASAWPGPWLNPNLGDRSSELMFQGYYQTRIANGVYLQPTLTYIPTPGVLPKYEGAWATSLRLTVLF
jgi:hypothetical protein